MCDYSLEHVDSRSAVTADRLVTAKFPGTITQGFAGVGDPKTAVCLQPGTELVFDLPPKYLHNWMLWSETAAGTLARFRQIDLDVPRAHHDALEFCDGTIVPLARLYPGQQAIVLQLPVVASPTSCLHRTCTARAFRCRIDRGLANESPSQFGWGFYALPLRLRYSTRRAAGGNFTLRTGTNKRLAVARRQAVDQVQRALLIANEARAAWLNCGIKYPSWHRLINLPHKDVAHRSVTLRMSSTGHRNASAKSVRNRAVCHAARQAVLHQNDMRSDFLWHKCGLRLIGEEQAIRCATVQTEK